MHARVIVHGKLVGSVRLCVNERAGLDEKDLKQLARSAAKAVATIIERREEA